MMSPAESSLLHDNVAFVLCLDTLGKSDELFVHVSRPPKPDTPAYSFIQQLEEVNSLTEQIWTHQTKWFHVQFVLPFR